MKKVLIVFVSMLWLALLVPAGHSRSKRPSARQQKQTFVYDLDETDTLSIVRLSRVEKDGSLKVVHYNHHYDDADVYYNDLDTGRLPHCIIATPNGRSLYVSSDVDTNDNHSGQIIEFAIGKSGHLTRLGSVDAGTLPLVLAMTRSGSFLYCSAEDGATGQGVLYQYKIERDGTLSALKPPLVSLGKDLFRPFAIAPSEKYLYMPTGKKPICFRISRSGALLRLPTPPTQENVEVLAITPSGKYAYCLQSGGVISVGAVDQVTGRFSPLRPVAHVPPASYSMNISPQRNTLQITDAYINSKNIMISGPISEFRLMPNGDLKPANPPTFAEASPAVKSYGRLAPDPSKGFVIVTR